MDAENEEEIHEAYGVDYLKFLNKRSTAKMNLVELLWMGFAHGYARGSNPKI